MSRGPSGLLVWNFMRVTLGRPTNMGTMCLVLSGMQKDLRFMSAVEGHKLSGKPVPSDTGYLKALSSKG